MPDPPFRTLRSRTVFENRWIELREDEVEKAADAHRFTYTYLSVADSVMVVALTAQAEIVLIRQYRYPSRCYSWELPGGGTAGSPPGETAARELEEETGRRAESIEKIGDFVTYCGLADEVCHVFLATGLEIGEQKLEATEDISVETVPYPRLREMIESGEFRDGMGLAALHIARRRLEKLLGER